MIPSNPARRAAPDRRDLEIERLKRQLAQARERERAVRTGERERFSALTAAGKRFATSMRSRLDERQRQQRRLDAQYAVSRVLEEFAELRGAAPEIFRALGARLGWGVGILWTVEAGALRCDGLWRAPGASTDGAPAGGFEEACRGDRFPRGSGLPGRVWRREEPCWVEDVLEDEGYARKEQAAAEGLRCALAFPIQDGGRLVGVFELLKEEPSPVDEDMLRTAYLVGHQMGQFVERRRAEAERDRALSREREARRQVGGILESINDAFFAVDRDWRLTYVNRRTEEFWQRSRDALLGRDLWEEFPEAVGSEVERSLRRAMESRDTVGFETVSPASGLWVSVRAYPSSDGLSVYFQDISGRKEGEEALRRNEARWRTLIDKGADVITISARDGTIGFASPSIETVCGHAVEEFVGKNPFETGHIHPDDASRCGAAFAELADRPGHSLALQHRYRHGTGEWRWLEGTFTNLFDDPAIGGLVANFRDVTERKGAEERSRRSAELDAERVELGDALRRLAEPAAIEGEACRLLGAHLDVDRAYYVEVNEAEGYARVERDHLRGDSPSLTGVFRSSDYGWTVPLLQKGEDIIVADAEDSDIVPEADREAMAAVKIAAHISIPVIKAGVLAGALCVTEAAPRRWTDGEIELVRETAERVWAAVERARAEKAVHESEERYRTLFASIDEGFYLAEVVRDEAGRAVDVRYLDENPAAERMVGRSFKGRLLSEVDPGYEQHWRDALGRTAKTGEPQRLERYAQPDGMWFDFNVFKPEGAKDDRTVAAVFQDVTERRRSEEALREGEEWLRIAQRAARAGTWEWDLRSGEIRWSSEHRELFGFGPSDEPVEREDWWAAVHPKDLPAIEEAGRRCFEEGAQWPEIEYRILRDGGTRWIDARGRTVRDENARPARILGISVDVTERKEAEAERDRLLAREWVASAEAAERERISRELHDRVAHSMGVAHQSLQLHGVLADKDAARAAEKLELARKMTKASLESTRNLSAELRSQEAEEGLEAELRNLLDVAVPPGVRAGLSVTGDESPVPGYVRGQLFLIMREAVRNAVAHSGCGSISVGLEVGEAQVTGRVEDDGVGFDANNGHAGVGLRSMRERTALLDGALDLRCEPGRGTRVTVAVPLKGER